MQVSEIHVGKRAMVDCIADIEVWCRSHGLKLNTDKSNVIWLDAKQQLSRMSQADKDLHLPSGTLQASETARNLGVDQQLTFDAHARACSRACFYHLRRIRQIRRFVDDWSLRLLIHAFITSRLDYCNGLFVNFSVAVRQRLQRIQNSAARLICSEPAFSHVAPLLQHSLHWLPVARRIKYKLCVLMFDVYHGTAPVYMIDYAAAVATIVYDHQLVVISLYGGQGHASPIVRSLSRDLLKGTHFLLTSGRLIHTLRSAVI